VDSHSKQYLSLVSQKPRHGGAFLCSSIIAIVNNKKLDIQ